MQELLSVAETAKRFNISIRRVQLLCEQGRIDNAQMVSGVWLIPLDTKKPQDGRKTKERIDASQISMFDQESNDISNFLSLDEVCKLLSISLATGKNWIKLKKIIPEKREGSILYFRSENVDKILHAVTNGESKALNRRRNKKKINGLSLYESYISNVHNIKLVNQIISGYQDSLNPIFVRSVLAWLALRFICRKLGLQQEGNILLSYLDGEISVGEYSHLLDDLLGDRKDIPLHVDLDSPIFRLRAEYVVDEDTLGFVYISLTNIGDRKASGAYYTPLNIVRNLLSHLTDTTDLSGKAIFDPCCGSGNFLMLIGEYTSTPELLYGQDIDAIAIQLARISFALRYDITDLDFLYTHFVCADTLTVLPEKTFDIVLGNPPWGGEISEELLLKLSARFLTATKNGSETYDLFTECGISLLSESGMLVFVLPEAILNVNAHSSIRKIILNECNFKFVHYLGNVFSGVQCPAIILGVEKAKKRCSGIEKVYIDNMCYSIRTDRQLTLERFNFRVRDELQDCLDDMSSLPNSITLLENAKFALGIVTGDNDANTSNIRLDGYEPVLKGSDVYKYRYITGRKYIKFSPQSFQQVAPTELYRAPEKLLYRFICETLVFAYDDQQTLSLNSCNIVIPQIPNISAKYILAIFNSRAANFYFINKFNSVKVLRSHIEQIPIPYPSENEQYQLIEIVNKIIKGSFNMNKVYNELDEIIMSLYRFSDRGRETIMAFMNERNLFLG